MAKPAASAMLSRQQAPGGRKDTKLVEWDTLRLETDGQVGTLTLDRPASLNAVNEQMTLDLEEACVAVQAEPELRVVVVRGEGRAFCSGMDLQAAANRPATSAALEAVWAPWQRALGILEQLNSLTIASIHGPCIGAGFELVLSCDFRIAANSAFFSLPQVLYGSPPDAGPSYRLAVLVGLAKAKEILILGRRFDTVQAERWGLLTAVVETETLGTETGNLVERCLTLGAQAATTAKHLRASRTRRDSDARDSSRPRTQST